MGQHHRHRLAQPGAVSRCTPMLLGVAGRPGTAAARAGPRRTGHVTARHRTLRPVDPVSSHGVTPASPCVAKAPVGVWGGSRFGCARGRSLRRGSTLAGSQPLLPSPEPE